MHSMSFMRQTKLIMRIELFSIRQKAYKPHHTIYTCIYLLMIDKDIHLVYDPPPSGGVPVY